MAETNLEHNAAEALKVIAAAEAAALIRIEAARTSTAPFISNDHDELMKLIQSVEDFHEEMRRTLDGLRNDYHWKIGNHEDRINRHDEKILKLQSANIKQNVMLWIILAVGGFMSVLLIYHVAGIQLGK